MAKKTPLTVTSGFASQTQLNAEFADIADHLNTKVLYRDNPAGEPNVAQTDFDLNSFNLNNVRNAENVNQAPNLGQVQALLGAGGSGLISSVTEVQTATNAQTVFNISAFTYTVGAQNLAVFVNGVKQYIGTAYSETSASSITFTEALDAGDLVQFISNESTTTEVAAATGITYAPSGETQTNVQSALQALDIENIAALRLISGTEAQKVLLNGYYASGDGGGGEFYWDSASTATDNGGMIIKATAITTGRWIRLDVALITPEMYGAVGDGDGIGGGTDDTTALQSWASSAHLNKALNGVYRCNDILTFPQHVSIKGSGSGISKIDFTGATGGFSGNRCVDFTQGSFTAIADLNAAVIEGDSQIVFAAAHGLAKGDIFVISNPTSSSWSGHLANFKAGEMCVVAEVVNSTTVNMLEPLYDGYASAAVDCYSFDYGTVNMEGVQFIGVGSASGVTTLFASHIAHSSFKDVFVSGGGDRAIDIRHAFDVDFNGTSYQYNSDTPGSAQYGLVMSFCQDMRVNGNFQGERHAVTTGSNSSAGAIVNRNIHISGNLKSLIRAALDFHGNIEHSSFDGGTINGAVAIGGDHNAIRNCTILGNTDIETGKLIRFREMLGCNFELSNITGRSQGNPVDDGGSGLIDAGGNNSTTLTSNTTRGGTIRIDNVLMEGLNSTSGIRLVNRGCTQDIDVVITGLVPRLSASTTTGFGYLRLENISGGDFRQLNIVNTSNPDEHPLSTTMDVTDGPVVPLDNSNRGPFYFGWIDVSGPTIINGPTGWTVAKFGTGQYDITHGLGIVTETNLVHMGGMVESTSAGSSNYRPGSSTSTVARVNVSSAGAAADLDFGFAFLNTEF